MGAGIGHFCQCHDALGRFFKFKSGKGKYDRDRHCTDGTCYSGSSDGADVFQELYSSWRAGTSDCIWSYHSNIELLEETHNPLSSLAMSFDRIYIHTSSGDDVLVAVKEKKAFIEEVYRRAGIF